MAPDESTAARGGTVPGPRLLLNAEPFGFGPAAAVAVLAGELAPVCARVDYFGSGHTLDLQRRPPYHAIHDVTGMSEEERRRRLASLAPGYDLFLTAMDYAMAALVRRTGLPVAVYDALTWFWDAVPELARDAALYLAQDFFGVRERLQADAALRRRAVVVPPLIPPRRDRRPGRHVLVNLGGLHHPFWRPEEAADYARAVLAALRAGLPADRRIIVATSRSITAALGDPAAGTHDHDTMLDLMSTAGYACMTPGLGNIYDAAATGVPTLWLPGANASHARQVRLLAAHGCCDAAVDWEDIGRPVDFGAPEDALGRDIARVVRELSGERRLRDALADRVRDLTAGLGDTTGKAQALTDHFGHGGMRPAAAAVLRWWEEHR